MGRLCPGCGSDRHLCAEFRALRSRVEALEGALREAAQSLETISQQAGREECLEDMTQVRGYANSRATVARAALQPDKGEEPSYHRVEGAFRSEAP